MLASKMALGDVDAIVDARFNAFEDVVLPHLPRLAALKRSLVAAGARGALLSGSGSSLFTLARTDEDARAIARGLTSQDVDVRVVRTRERGVSVTSTD
jgi:4-diphosphocytidyl-2-C-methyl-D-erythritol kinase